MTHPVHKSNIHISPVHRAAIGKEIGERLRTFLNHRSVRLPSSLVKLMQRFRDGRSRNSANPRA
jgi:hypothetical protein